MRWHSQLMCILPSLSCVRMSRLSMTDIVMSNSRRFLTVLDLTGLDEFVQTLLGQYQCHLRFCSTESS